MSAKPLLLNQFNLVSVGIFDKRNRRSPVLPRTRLAHAVDAFLLQVAAGLIDVFDAERDMPVRVAEIVLRGPPIPGELDNRGLVLTAVTDKRERELAARKILLAEQPHPELVAIELERFVEVVHPEHRVQKSHRFYPLLFEVAFLIGLPASRARFESIAFVSSL